MKLWLLIPLIFILISASYNLITDYYGKGQLTLVNSISDSCQKTYDKNLRTAFKEVIKENKKKFPNIFKKEVSEK